MHFCLGYGPSSPLSHGCLGCSKARPLAVVPHDPQVSLLWEERPTWCGTLRRILLPQFEPLAPSVPPQLSSSLLSAGESQPSGGVFLPEDTCYCPLPSGKEGKKMGSGSPQLPDFSPKPLWRAKRKSWFEEVRPLKRTQEKHEIAKAVLNENKNKQKKRSKMNSLPRTSLVRHKGTGDWFGWEGHTKWAGGISPWRRGESRDGEGEKHIRN